MFGKLLLILLILFLSSGRAQVILSEPSALMSNNSIIGSISNPLLLFLPTNKTCVLAGGVTQTVDGNQNLKNIFISYDYGASWRGAGSIPLGQDSLGFSLITLNLPNDKDKLLLAGGSIISVSTGSPMALSDIFSGQFDSITNKFIFSRVGSLPLPLSNFGFLYLNEVNQLFVVAGWANGTFYYNNFYLSNVLNGPSPANTITWTDYGSAPFEGRHSVMCSYLNNFGLIIVAGGMSPDINFDDVWLFQLSTKSWTQTSTSALWGPRDQANMAFVGGGYLFVIGGIGVGSAVGTVYYDAFLSTDFGVTWTQLPSRDAWSIGVAGRLFLPHQYPNLASSVSSSKIAYLLTVGGSQNTNPNTLASTVWATPLVQSTLLFTCSTSTFYSTTIPCTLSLSSLPQGNVTITLSTNLTKTLKSSSVQFLISNNNPLVGSISNNQLPFAGGSLSTNPLITRPKTQVSAHHHHLLDNQGSTYAPSQTTSAPSATTSMRTTLPTVITLPPTQSSIIPTILPTTKSKTIVTVPPIVPTNSVLVTSLNLKVPALLNLNNNGGLEPFIASTNLSLLLTLAAVPSSNVQVCVEFQASSSYNDYDSLKSTCLYPLIIPSSTPPSITAISPSSIPLSNFTNDTTTNLPIVTVVGHNFKPGVRVFIGGLAATIVGDNEKASNTTISFIPPSPPCSAWYNSYQTIQIVNTDGTNIECGPPSLFGVASCPNAPLDTYALLINTLTDPTLCMPYSDTIYYLGSTCSAAGQYLTKSGVCMNCPSGASCPGGARIWPNPGYWNSNPFDPSVYHCNQPDTVRCLGGQFSTCGKGYTGIECSQCATNYYANGLTCVQCPTSTDLQYVFIVIVTVAFYGAIGFLLIFVSNKWLDRSAILIVGFQQLILIGQSVEYALPQWLVNIVNFCQIFTFQFAYFRPECNNSNFSLVQIFYVSLAGLLCVYGYFVLCALIYQHIKRGSNSNWLTDSNKPRVFRALVVCFYITFLPVAILSIQMLYCVTITLDNSSSLSTSSTFTSLRLYFQQEQACYDRTHTPAAVLAWLLLIVYCGGLPICFFFILRNGHLNDLLTEKAFRYRWGFLYRDLRSRWYWYRLLVFAINFLVAIQIGLSSQSVNLQAGIAFATFGSDTFLLLLIRPMQKWFDTITPLVGGCIKLFWMCTVLFYSSFALLGGVLLATGILLILMGTGAHHLFFARLNQSDDKIQQENIQKHILSDSKGQGPGLNGQQGQGESPAHAKLNNTELAFVNTENPLRTSNIWNHASDPKNNSILQDNDNNKQVGSSLSESSLIAE